MTSRSKKDRKQRHTIQLSRSNGSVAQSTSETKSDRQHFLDRLSVALPNDAAEEDERREIEHLFSQLPVIDSPKRPSVTDDNNNNNDSVSPGRRHRSRHGRHRHHDDKNRPTSPPSSAATTATRLSSSSGRRRSATIDNGVKRALMSSPVASPRLPSLEELGVPLPPVVVHMLELDRAKRRDTVKSMLKQCSKEDRTRFRYELQRLRQQHVQKKADNARLLAASASSVATPAPASSSSSSKLERAKTATGAIDASARLKSSTAAAAAAKTSELRPASTAAPSARPTVRANGVKRDEADVIRRLSVNSSLKRILSGYLDDDDDDEDDDANDLVAAPPSLVPPAGAAAQSPRNGTTSNGTTTAAHAAAGASTSPRLSYGGISARTRAPPSIAALEQHSDSDSDAPPLPPSSTAPSLDLDELLGV